MQRAVRVRPMPARRALTVHQPDHAHALAPARQVQVRAPQGEIMKLCGWKTRAMFDRYNTIDEIDLAQAVAKRFNGKVTAKSSTPAPDGASLSGSPASSAAYLRWLEQR